MAEYPIITDVTYDELVALRDGSLLEPGLYYRITDYLTTCWLMRLGNSGLEYVYPAAPAPGNITIIPDAVGSNPYSLYFKLYYDDAAPTSISLGSEVIEVQVGDDTDHLDYSCGAIPDWANAVHIFWGTSPEVYDKEVIIGASIGEFSEESGSPINYDAWLAVQSLHYLDEKIVMEVQDDEPLTVLALAVNELSPFATSEFFPDDIIHYQLDLGTEKGLISNTIDSPWYNGTESDADFVPGFKGIITYRKDIILNLSAQLDWRNWLYRKYSIEQRYWVAQGYDPGAFVQDSESGDLIIYKAKQGVFDEAQVETITLVCPDNPAPGNITVVPDAVGANPVTYYYKVCYAYENGSSIRSVFSPEATYTEGESTTETIFNCEALPAWRNGVYIFRGTETGVYTHYFTFYDNSDVDIYGEFILDESGLLAAITSYPTTGGAGQITEVGGLTREINYSDDLTTTASDFVTAFAEDYAESGVGVIVTSNGADLIFTSDTAGVPITPPVITNNTGNLNGTVAHTTANHSVDTFPYLDPLYWDAVMPGLTKRAACLSYGTVFATGYYGDMPIVDLEDYQDIGIFGANCYNIELQDDLCFSFIGTVGLPFITFGSACGSMTFDSGCYNMTFDSGCGTMTFGSSCGTMTFGLGCSAMTFGASCGTMTFGLGCSAMTFGARCYNMTFDSGCGTMTFGLNCSNMTFGLGCSAMTFGARCSAMSFGPNCGVMTFGSGCITLTFGSGCGNMTFGSGCSAMTFGLNCSNMTFGSGCGSMTFPDFSNYNDFKDGFTDVDFTDSGANVITNRTTVTHQRVGIQMVHSYMIYNTDHYETIITDEITIAIYD